MIGNLRNMANDMGQEVDTIIHTTFANYCYHICILLLSYGRMIRTMTSSIAAHHDDGQVHKQNDQLDRINKKAESDKMRVKQANDKAQALLK